MSNITFTEPAFAQYLYWQTQDKRTLKKIKRGSNSLQRAGCCLFYPLSHAPK
nr:type II toxin-antitoxin system YoeB family toxin [uncultured Selenomonas sp.]